MPRAVSFPCLLHLALMKNVSSEIYGSSFYRTELLLLFRRHFVCMKSHVERELKSADTLINVSCVFLLSVLNPVHEILDMSHFLQQQQHAMHESNSSFNRLLGRQFTPLHHSMSHVKSVLLLSMNQSCIL